MHWAVINSNWKIVGKLLEADTTKEHCQIRDKLGNTVLHYLMKLALVATERMTADEKSTFHNLVDMSDVNSKNKVVYMCYRTEIYCTTCTYVYIGH